MKDTGWWSKTPAWPLISVHIYWSTISVIYGLLTQMSMYVCACVCDKSDTAAVDCK